MENSKIEWCDHTFNGWRGCTKVSPGCANCYAEALSKRTGHGEYRRGIPRTRSSDAYWRQPLKWNRDAAQSAPAKLANYLRPDGGKRRPRVFCASLADWLDDEVPIEWLADLLKLIHDTPHLDWLLLTKRPQHWFNRIQESRNFLTKGGCAHTALWLNDWLPTLATRGVYSRGRQATSDMPAMPGEPPHNVWIGVSVEDQERGDERIPELLKIPARVRFLSCEPLLRPVDLRGWLPDAEADQDTSAFQTAIKREDGLHWVIVGGESGPKARPTNPAWARSIRDQCKEAGVAFLFKQWGEWRPATVDEIHDRGKIGKQLMIFEGQNVPTKWMRRVGKKAAGRLLDGRTWDEFPEVNNAI